jgi:hypothetical protein
MRDTLIFIVILSVIVVATFALVFLGCRDDARGGGGLGLASRLIWLAALALVFFVIAIATKE